MPTRNNIWRLAPRAAGLAAALVLAGCDEYLDRRDTLTYGVGDSVAVNRSTQTIERWPPASRYDRWASDGERARLAVEKYRRRDVRIAPAEKEISGGAQTTAAGP
jgi:hypothetical protein